MREPTVAISDDLHFHEDGGKRVQAGVTASVGYNGEWVDLDLTDEHGEELAGFITRYMIAGTRTKTPYRPRRNYQVTAGSDVSAARIRRKAQREFAEEHGIPYKHGHGGKNDYFYSADLEERFAAWEASQRGTEEE